ncbi:MAG: M15 family metallopeptidase [Chloroflexota bacterium]
MIVGILLSSLFLAGCRSFQAEPAAVVVEMTAAMVTETAVPPSPSPTLTATRPNRQVTVAAPASPTPIPTQATPTPIPPTITPTATPIGLCSLRMPGDDLLTLVTQTYNLSRNYAPDDLVLLTDYLPMEVTLGYPSEIREVVLEPLLTLVADMKAAGLQPQVISGYRSYYAQSVAWEKWSEEYDHASIVSARPGHSEHQLGTVVDFGSPTLAEVVGTPDIQFHTYFFKTPEGVWLLENAHRYGFTLSYTREAFEITGFYYEPWHYRYVGPEMAALLKDLNLTLTEYQLINQPEPCIPD